jgi:hypothetical protein
MPHIIRLRGGWESIPSEDRVHHSRNFGRPRTLDAHERVWLICQNVPGPFEVYLNGQAIGGNREMGSFAADITDLLQTRNTILFAVTSSEPLGEVCIEIREIK